MKAVSYRIRGLVGEGEFSFRNQLVEPDTCEDFCSYENLRIVRILSGSCQWKIANRSYPVTAGHIVILAPTEKRAHTAIETDAPFIQEVITFSPAFVYPCLDCLQVFYKRPAHFSHVLSPETVSYPDVLCSFENIATEAKEGKPWCKTAIRGHFLILLTALTRAYGLESSSLHFSLHTFETICHTVVYVSQHLKDDLSVPALAAYANLSVSHFSRLFTEVWGLSPSEYVRIRRVRRALEMIAEGNINVLDAAYACGFTSSSGFYKAVHMVTGQSPGKAILLQTNPK